MHLCWSVEMHGMAKSGIWLYIYQRKTVAFAIAGYLCMPLRRYTQICRAKKLKLFGLPTTIELHSLRAYVTHRIGICITYGKNSRM